MSNSGETVLNNRYVLKAQQGSGGMAVIYRAHDLALGRTVAIKILRPSLTNDPSFLTRFRNEARAVANLSHPNIVTVHDVGNEGSTSYIVMEFVDGQDLKKIIKTEGVLSVKRALDLAIQICAGIGFAHRAGLVHADVKPQNILVTNDNRVKVTDFGIAQALTDTQPMQRQEVVWGSPHYFAPEQARGEKPTPAADVYAIGIVLFEMLTGRLPYTGATQQELAMAHIKEPVPMVTQFNPSVPENLAKIVYKVMSKEPSARYRMADQLGHVLQSYQERSQQHTSVNAPPVPSMQIPPPPPPPQSIPAQRPPNVPQSVPQGSRPMPAQPSQPLLVPSPQQVIPPVRPDAEPTVRSNLAPNAPEAPTFSRPAVSPNNVAGQPGFEPISPGQPQTYQPVEQRQDSREFYTQPPNYTVGESGPLDVVTIILAVLAFFAVACLIPLWIAVFQARFGG
jgi:eukaryotic-like serine/threonine-protein kinase